MMNRDHPPAERFLSVNDDAELEREDPTWSKKKQKIVKKILADFDIDKVREKYRSSNKTAFRVHPSEYSVDCALAISLIRQRLLYLMGTDQVRINDREYVQRLIDRVEEEYEKEVEKKERVLMENEKRRLRRLLADGVVTPDQINEMDVQKRENHRELRTPPPHEQNHCEKLVTEKRKPFIYFDERNKRIHDEKSSKGSEDDTMDDLSDENTEDHDRTMGDDEKAGYKSDDVDPLILNLRDGNTVEELYRRAEELLRGN